MFIMQILESVPQVAKWRLSGAHVRSVIPKKIKIKIKLTLVIPPNFLGLPVFASFNFVINLLLVLEVFLTGHRTSLVSVLEDVLTLGHNLVALELPEDSSTIITTTCKKSADDVPANAIYRLLVIGQLCKLSHTLHLFLVKEGLHGCDIRPEGSIIILCLNDVLS